MSTPSGKVDEIFGDALEIASEPERCAYLDQACGSDAELRRRVEKMLHAQPKAERFLEKPLGSFSPTLDQTVSQQLGTSIGPYKIIEEIGEGGMGLVFMARQREPVKRNVALKIIKPGMGSRQVVARFEAERQALALMDHPNIARILDGGTTESGLPFFVMDLVRGMPITAYCDQQHLGTRERLELFVTVCQAVQHAHQKGIIHRDIKPSNVLITLHDGAPVPKVIDFGVAKALHQSLTEESLLTGFQQLVGTPLYMSPEQAELSGLDIDTRSDVYSLGVLLYELLTGLTPFDRKQLNDASLDEVRRIIREDEPPRPSTRISTLDAAGSRTIAQQHGVDARQLGHQLRGELDWIVMKALEKDRSRRYESANELAKDVQRYLSDEPVEACPPSRAYRLRKVVRRYRTSLGVMALIFLILLAGIAATSWQTMRARREQEHAQQAAESEQLQRKEAERQRQIAKENFERAREAVDKYLTKVSEEQLLNNPGLQPLRKDLLELALKYYREFIAERGADPALQGELADAYERVGNITKEIGKQEETLDAYQHALSIRSTLAEQHQGIADYQAKLAQSYRKVGGCQQEVGMQDEALASYNKAIDILQDVVAANPDVPEFQHGLAQCQNSLSLLQRDMGKIDEATTSIRRAIDLGEKIADEDPAHREFRHLLAGYYNNLGKLQQDTGSLAEAQNSFQKAIEITGALVAEDPSSLDYPIFLAKHYNNFGQLQMLTGRPEEAITSFQMANDIWKKLAAENPAVVNFRSGLAGAYNSVGTQLAVSGKYDEAIASFRQAIEIQQRLATENPAVVKFWNGLAGTHTNLGQLQKIIGMQTEATSSLLKAIEIQERLAAENPTVVGHRANIAAAYNMLGLQHISMGKHVEAVTFCQKALGVRETLADDYPAILDHQRALADAYNHLSIPQEQIGNYEEAITSRQMAIQIGQKLVAEHPERHDFRHLLAGFHQNLGMLLEKSDRVDEARASYQHAIRLSEAAVAEKPALPRYRYFLSHHYDCLGVLHKSLGNLGEAQTSCQKALDLRKKLASENPGVPDFQHALAASYQNVGEVHQAAQRHEDALSCFRQAIEIWEPLTASNPVAAPYRHSLAGVYYSRGVIQRELGKQDEAKGSFHKVIEILTTIPPNQRTIAQWSDLGRALYLTGRWEEAREALVKATEIRGEEAPTLAGGPRWWYLTMALAQLGEKTTARAYYDQLLKQLDQQENPGQDDLNLCAEAARLLRITNGNEKPDTEANPDDGTAPSGEDSRKKAAG